MTDCCRSCAASRVQLRVPQRGDKRALMETVERNAKDAFTQHKLRRAGDLTARSAALQELQDALALDTAPLRIECIDISHIQGSDVVASLVVFEDGLAAQVRVPPVRDQGGGHRGRRRLDRRGRAPPLPPVPPGDAGDRRPERPASTRRPGGRASSPTRRTCWSSTAPARRPTRPRTCSPSWASTTSRSSAWPSAWRRSGCPPTGPGDPAAHQRGRCTCCSGCATRRTGSPSPTTGRSGPSG